MSIQKKKKEKLQMKCKKVNINASKVVRAGSWFYK